MRRLRVETEQEASRLRGGMQTVAIDINVWRARTELLIQVGNTCSAAPPVRAVSRRGLGLSSARARLEMLFGRGARFRAERTDNGRFEVQIGLPLRESRAAGFREDRTCV
jgi:LytS/YehU family sensor histidine kinase